MANYNSAKAAATPKWLEDSGGCNVFSTYTFAASGTPTLHTNDTITMATIPAGVTVLQVLLDCDSLDSNGSPTIKLNVGDAGNTSRYISQTTIAQAGGYQVPNVNGGTGYSPTVNTPLLVTVQTGATGTVPASATCRVSISYTADP